MRPTLHQKKTEGPKGTAYLLLLFPERSVLLFLGGQKKKGPERAM